MTTQTIDPWPLATKNGREFAEFVTALITLRDRDLITPEEARRALSDWGMRLDSPMRMTVPDAPAEMRALAQAASKR